MHVELGGYHVRDVEFVAAFDVDAKKVGQRRLRGHLRRARTTRIQFSDVPPTGVTVQRGRTLDGLGELLPRARSTESDERRGGRRAGPHGRAGRRARSATSPVGSEEADRFYAQCAIDAKVAFVNALPVFIASDPVWAQRFADAGVPIVGDDIK